MSDIADIKIDVDAHLCVPCTAFSAPLSLAPVNTAMKMSCCLVPVDRYKDVTVVLKKTRQQGHSRPPPRRANFLVAHLFYKDHLLPAAGVLGEKRYNTARKFRHCENCYYRSVTITLMPR